MARYVQSGAKAFAPRPAVPISQDPAQSKFAELRNTEVRLRRRVHRSLLGGIMATRGAREQYRREVLGMIVRIVSVRVTPEHIDEIVGRYREIVRPVHQRSEGLRNHYVLVDRQSGQMRLIGLWDSQEALETALPTLESVREQLWEEFGEDPTLEAYEVADAL
jgi:quinol monooxygenase YgiN